MGDGYFERLGIGPAGDVVARLGRRLPGPQRLPRRAARPRGATNNYGDWTLAGVRRGDRPRPSRRPIRRPPAAAYDRAETIVRDEVPVVPRRRTGPGWALSRTGLLGAGQNGLGIVRMAGLAWAN